jgi:AcrR family transcriptional regulator
MTKMLDEQDRKDAVLESALATFARFGYRKTSMEEVARAARISRPGLYFLFDSKEALFRAAATRAIEHDLAEAERALLDRGGPLQSRLLEAFDHWAGRYVGPLTSDIPVVIGENPELLGEIVHTAPVRFATLITDAIATSTSSVSADAVAQTLLSTSVGLKYQVSSRDTYLARLATAIALLVR